MFICARDSPKRRDYIEQRYRIHKEMCVSARGRLILRLYNVHTLLCSSIHQNLCVRGRPIQRLYKTYKKVIYMHLCARDRLKERLYTSCNELIIKLPTVSDN